MLLKRAQESMQHQLLASHRRILCMGSSHPHMARALECSGEVAKRAAQLQPSWLWASTPTQ